MYLMGRPKNTLPQFSLRAFFEITACCALLITALLRDNLFISWLVFAFLMVWSIRVQDLPLRWSLMSCLGGCATVFFGLMCLQLAFAKLELGPYRRTSECLAFLGPLFSGCGMGIALTGLVLTFRCLNGLRVMRD